MIVQRAKKAFLFTFHPVITNAGWAFPNYRITGSADLQKNALVIIRFYHIKINSKDAVRGYSGLSGEFYRKRKRNLSLDLFEAEINRTLDKVALRGYIFDILCIRAFVTYF